MSATGAAVVVEGVELRYPTGPVVVRVDRLVARRGRTTALVGPNGSGKSTLLAAIAGLIAPVRGTIAFAPDGRRDRARAPAMVFQATPRDAVLPLTVADVVAMGRFGQRGLLGRWRREDRAAVGRAVAAVGVEDLVDRQLSELSGGQRQRALVARALAAEAPVLLLDEATAGVDGPSAAAIMAAVDAERRRGVAVVAASHRLDEAARADEVVVLAGRVVASGPPAAVLTEERLARAYLPTP